MNPWVCAGINQFAWPGLGSIMGGRAVGFVQAALMLIGFILFLGFFLFYLKNMWAWAANPQGTEEDFRAGYRPYMWTWMVGLGLCVFSWSWSLATTITLIRSAPRPPPTLPPRLEPPAEKR
jgi:hypothetical protein